MTKPSDNSVLEKAIRKAVDNGWLGNIKRVDLIFGTIANTGGHNIQINSNIYGSYDELIFDHSFAKALWGDKFLVKDSLPHLRAWQYHLQELAISEDRIKYLEENI